MRRYGHPKDINQTYLDRPGAYGIILLGKKILCTLQKTPEPELQLPGGGIDLGENPMTALHREVREETGWRISILYRLGPINVLHLCLNIIFMHEKFAIFILHEQFVKSESQQNLIIQLTGLNQEL